MQTTIRGVPFEVAPQPADYWGWIREGRYDHEWKVYDAHLKPKDVFIDLGAWVGAHSLYASRIAALVIAVEPDPVAYRILKTNTAPIERLVAFPQAVGVRGTVKMGSGWLGASTTRTNPAAGGGIGEWDPEQTFEVASLTLRDCLQNTTGPLFIKIDVEGSEEELFKDLEFFRERKPTMLVELHPFWWADEEKTQNAFTALKSLYKVAYEVPHPNSKTWVLAND